MPYKKDIKDVYASMHACMHSLLKGIAGMLHRQGLSLSIMHACMHACMHAWKEFWMSAQLTLTVMLRARSLMSLPLKGMSP